MVEKEQEEQTVYTIGEARVINNSLFVKDQYVDDAGNKATPSYKIEIAIPKESDVLFDLEEAMYEFAEDEWGPGADEDVWLPMIDGDKLARRREKKGKEGDAYKGMEVLRASTFYNKDGNDDVGGVQVYDEEVNPIPPTQKGKIYNGCYGCLAVTFKGYTKKIPARDRDEDDLEVNAITCYIQAFQKTADGEKLSKSADRSSLFKPVKRESSEGRRRRRRDRE